MKNAEIEFLQRIIDTNGSCWKYIGGWQCSSCPETLKNECYKSYLGKRIEPNQRVQVALQLLMDELVVNAKV
jgi:hypothetical protein